MFGREIKKISLCGVVFGIGGGEERRPIEGLFIAPLGGVVRFGGDAPVLEIIHVVAGIHGEIFAVGGNHDGGGVVIVLGLEGMVEDEASCFVCGQDVGDEIDVAGAIGAIGTFGGGD